jgi:hypothetical protein
LELEQARYQVHLAARRYEAVDPDNRLVAAELEARWNAALRRWQNLELRLRKDEQSDQPARMPDKDTLRNLAHDLAAVWNRPTTDMRLKQRIVRILVAEIVADVDQENQPVVLLIHWTGGQHSELRLKKNTTGRHSRCTSLEAVEIIRRMAGRFPDEQIAATLNRLGVRTGAGNTWREGNIRSVRSYRQLPAYVAIRSERNTITLEEASAHLAVSHMVVRRLIEDGKSDMGHLLTERVVDRQRTQLHFGDGVVQPDTGTRGQFNQYGHRRGNRDTAAALKVAVQSERLLNHMLRLRLSRLPNCYEAIAEEASAKNLPYLDILEQFLWAHFPYNKGLDQFDFAFQPSVDETQAARTGVARLPGT